MGRLSMNDVARLGVDPSPAARVDLVRKIVGEVETAGLSQSERAIAQQIFAAMARDAEILVRSELSRNLQSSPALTRELACILARDVDAVAIPILASATVLTDEDLIGIIRSGAAAKQTAIAGRALVSGPVASALVDSDNADAVVVLAGNANADLDEGLLCRMLERYGTNEGVQGGIAGRTVLPIVVAERLVAVASELICVSLMARGDVPADVVVSLVLRSREHAVLGLREMASSDESAAELVDHLIQSGRLTPSFCLRALCVGDVVLFEMALARLSCTSLANARCLLQEAGELGFKKLFEKSGIPLMLLPAFRTALDVAREMDGAEGPDDRYEREEMTIQRILTQFEGLETDDVQFLLNRLVPRQALGQPLLAS